jgi:hypothetical protein
MKYLILALALFVFSCRSKPVVSVRWKGDTLVIYSPKCIDLRLDSSIVQRTFTDSTLSIKGVFITGKKAANDTLKMNLIAPWPKFGIWLNGAGGDSTKLEAPPGVLTGHSSYGQHTKRYFLIGYLANTQEGKLWTGGIDTIMSSYPNKNKLCWWIHERFSPYGLYDIKIISITEQSKEDYYNFWRQ